MVSNMIVQRGANSSNIPPPCSISLWCYDVFLSFRGEDTREKFIDHLYTALDQKGIYTFKDDEKLERGKAISPELLKAIEESRFSIVVVSENYASSRWCLDELVKILDCKNTMGQTVYPVFYHVDPSEVRRQTGKVGEGFAKVVSRNQMEKVQKWREALVEIANLSGWPYPSATHRFESKFIQELIGDIFPKLDHTPGSDDEDLVGMTSRVEKVIALLCLGLYDVRVVGIWGMGGIGKTTIAKAVYNRIAHQFECSSYLENVREVSTKSGLPTLQEQLVNDILKEKDLKVTDTCRGTSMIKNRACHKKVLIVLDDVDAPKQIENLVGRRDWFGFGSRIIITTRDKHLLTAYNVEDIYEVKELEEDDAMTLFCSKAFGKDHQTRGFEKFLYRAIEYAGGVPLALKVLGSSLNGRSKHVWGSALNRLKERPNKEVSEVLKISYDALDPTEKQIFLDIACFWKGEYKNAITKILDSIYDFSADYGISLLVEKSLITIWENKLWMHDLIQELGWSIVRQDKEPGERSRLWLYEDVYDVLVENTGTKSVESIVLKFPREKQGKPLKLGAKAFAKMTKLRLLKICDVQLPKGLKYLSTKLRYLDWQGYPLKGVPPMFQPKHLVELHMSKSCIEQLWEGTTGCKRLQELPELTPWVAVIDASDCQLLRTIASPSTYKNIFAFDFRNCIKLLAENNKQMMNILDVLLLNQFQGNSAPGFGSFHITFPGSEVPKWFRHRNDTGPSISLGWPYDWYSGSRVWGVAVCAVIGIEDTDGSSRTTTTITARVNLVEIKISTIRDQILLVPDLSFNTHSSTVGLINTDVVWIKYFPAGSARMPPWTSDSSEYQVYVTIEGQGVLKVKKCGVRLVYKEHDDDDDEIDDDYDSDYGVDDDDVLHGVFMDMSMEGTEQEEEEEATAIPKRRRRVDFNDKEEAGPGPNEGGSASFDHEEEEPNRKRLRQFFDPPVAVDLDLNKQAGPSECGSSSEEDHPMDSAWRLWFRHFVEPNMDLDLNNHHERAAEASGDADGSFDEEDPIDLQLSL